MKERIQRMIAEVQRITEEFDVEREELKKRVSDLEEELRLLGLEHKKRGCKILELKQVIENMEKDNERTG